MAEEFVLFCPPAQSSFCFDKVDGSGILDSHGMDIDWHVMPLVDQLRRAGEYIAADVGAPASSDPKSFGTVTAVAEYVQGHDRNSEASLACMGMCPDCSEKGFHMQVPGWSIGNRLVDTFRRRRVLLMRWM